MSYELALSYVMSYPEKPLSFLYLLLSIAQ